MENEVHCIFSKDKPFHTKIFVMNRYFSLVRLSVLLLLGLAGYLLARNIAHENYIGAALAVVSMLSAIVFFFLLHRTNKDELPG